MLRVDLVLLLVCCVAGLALFFLTTSPLARLGVVAILCAPQFYLPSLYGVSPTALVGLSILLVPAAVIQAINAGVLEVNLVVLFVVLEVVALVWSPNTDIGLRVILYQAPFVAAFSLSAALVARGRFFDRSWLLSWATLPLAAESLLVILFRVSPATESLYLSSSIAGLFAPSSGLRNLYTTARNNVIDASKSGGIFLNANIASVFLGVSAIALFTLASYSATPRLCKTAGLLCLIGTLFTGSVLALVLAPVLITLFAVLLTGRQLRFRVGLLAVVLVIGALLQALGLIDVASDREDSADIRLAIWRFAGTEFLRSPVIGLGFGGWQQRFGAYAPTVGLDPTIPPHNSLIYSWAQIGVLGTLVIVLVIVVILWTAIRLVMSGTVAERTAGAGAISIVLWVVFHGSFENFGFIGDEHIQVLLGIVSGLTIGLRLRQRRGSDAFSLAPDEGIKIGVVH